MRDFSKPVGEGSVTEAKDFSPFRGLLQARACYPLTMARRGIFYFHILAVHIREEGGLGGSVDIFENFWNLDRIKDRFSFSQSPHSANKFGNLLANRETFTLLEDSGDFLPYTRSSRFSQKQKKQENRVGLLCSFF